MSSKLNIGSKIYNATTGVESGDILHDGTYTAITAPTATDTLLIKQSGQQRQITHFNLTKFTYTTLGSLATGTGTITIAPSNGLNSLIVVEAEAYNSAAVATWTGPLGAMSSSSSYTNSLYAGSTLLFSYHRNTAGTAIIITAANVPNVYALTIHEVKVGS
jgi:hypothetical protein